MTAHVARLFALMWLLAVTPPGQENFDRTILAA